MQSSQHLIAAHSRLRIDLENGDFVAELLRAGADFKCCFVFRIGGHDGATGALFFQMAEERERDARGGRRL